MTNTMIERQIRHWERYQDKHRTSHVLHLLLTLLTAGFWIVIWLLVTLSNANERIKAQHRINKLERELSDE